jgi:hypothetical protein
MTKKLAAAKEQHTLRNCNITLCLCFAGFKPERTLIFGFGHDEEVGGSKGAAHLAQLLTSRFPLQGSSRNARSHSVLE